MRTLEAKGRPAAFRHGQAVHVGAQGHHGAGLAAFQQGHHAGAAHAGLHFQAQLAQVVGHEGGGAGFLVAQLGVLVHVAPPGNYLGLLLVGQLGNAGRKGGGFWAQARARRQQVRRPEGKRSGCA